MVIQVNFYLLDKTQDKLPALFVKSYDKQLCRRCLISLVSRELNFQQKNVKIVFYI